jgi:AP-1-like transcription factor
MSQSPISNGLTDSPKPATQEQGSVDSLSGLFSPSILEASRHSSMGGYFGQTNYNGTTKSNRGSLDNGALGNVPGLYPTSSVSNTDSPGSSSESHNPISSIGTSPEPSLNSPANKLNDFNLNTINENDASSYGGKDYLCTRLQQACGCADDPISPALKMVSNEETSGYMNGTGFDTSAAFPGSINWMAQQNNNTFDPVLFGDYRETQDNILSQDFGTFFNDVSPPSDGAG